MLTKQTIKSISIAYPLFAIVDGDQGVVIRYLLIYLGDRKTLLLAMLIDAVHSVHPFLSNCVDSPMYRPDS